MGLHFTSSFEIIVWRSRKAWLWKHQKIYGKIIEKLNLCNLGSFCYSCYNFLSQIFDRQSAGSFLERFRCSTCKQIIVELSMDDIVLVVAILHKSLEFFADWWGFLVKSWSSFVKLTVRNLRKWRSFMIQNDQCPRTISSECC